MARDHEFLESLFNNSSSASTCLLILHELYQEGNLGRTVKLGTKALGLFPQDIPLMSFMASIYKKAGFLGLAEQILSKAASRLDELASVYKSLAQILAEQNRNEEALTALEKYLSHSPYDQEAVEMKEALTPAKDFEEELIEEIPEAPPEQQVVTLDELTEATEVPEIEEANLEEITPEEELAEGPVEGTELASPTLAEIYFSQGQLQDAIQIYEQYLSTHPENLDASKRLAELKAIMEGQSLEGEPEVHTILEKRGRTIAVLESWLSKIQELNRVQ